MEEKTPNGAVITRQWYESCLELLPNAADRCAVYESILAMTFKMQEPFITSPVVKAVFTMVRPFVLQDIDKYNARCARNKENATRSHSQPLAATRSDSQPLATNNNNNNNNNINNNTKNNISNEIVDPEREKYLCLLTFLRRGACNPLEEFRVFWNYYESLGWKNKNGATIVRKVSAAAMWRIQGDIVADTHSCERWAKACATLPPNSTKAVQVFRDIQMNGEELILIVDMKAEEISAFEKACGPALSCVLRDYQAKSLSYTIRHDPR